jgi:hypothetical protein
MFRERVISRMIRLSLARLLWTNWTFNRFFNHLRSRKHVVVRNFDLVFDGFPRSSNTFGAFMVLATQKDRLKVLMHEHKPSLFYRAARIGKPACLTLRDPVDAAASWVLYTGFPVQKVIDYYIFFYEVLLPVRSKFLVLPFSAIIEDFTLVVQLINMRFDLGLVTNFDGEACRAEALRRIEALFTDEQGVLDPLKVPWPEKTRKERNAEIRSEILSSRHAGGLARCRELYAIYEGEYRRDLATLRQGARRPGISPNTRRLSRQFAS